MTIQEIPLYKTIFNKKSPQPSIKKLIPNLENNDILLLRLSENDVYWVSKVCKSGHSIINSYIKKQYTRSHIKYWRSLRNNKMGAKDIMTATKRSYWSVLDAMKRDSKLGLVSIEITKTPGQTHFYSLTEKGEKLLNIIGG